jgi:hypothetical protein
MPCIWRWRFTVVAPSWPASMDACSKPLLPWA